ncbi:MAG: hypothetical protein ACI32N_07500 [Bulleidia sp.]
MKKKMIYITAAAVIIIASLSGKFIYDQRHPKPSDEFVEIMDCLYSEDIITILDERTGKDVTEQFKEKYRTDYENSDFQIIYDDFSNTYSASYNPLEFENWQKTK